MAADLQIFVNDEIQDFTTDDGREVVAAFLRECAALGCTGIGAGPGYMGGRTNMHVGYGKQAVWGADGRFANAPSWLVEAVTEGWDNPSPLDDHS